jgi:hypothetical protein
LIHPSLAVTPDRNYVADSKEPVVISWLKRRQVISHLGAVLVDLYLVLADFGIFGPTGVWPERRSFGNLALFEISTVVLLR